MGSGPTGVACTSITGHIQQHRGSSCSSINRRLGGTGRKQTSVGRLWHRSSLTYTPHLEHHILAQLSLSNTNQRTFQLINCANKTTGATQGEASGGCTFSSLQLPSCCRLKLNPLFQRLTDVEPCSLDSSSAAADVCRACWVQTFLFLSGGTLLIL